MAATLKQQDPAAPRMTLTALTRGRIEAPDRVLLVGTEGIGKSTWAASAPAPIFVPAEDGTGALDVTRFPAPKSWTDVLDAVTVLRKEPHEFKTLVFDTMDAIEPLVWQYICQRDKKLNIEEYGYGKGYVAALDEWRIFLSELEKLRRERGMMIVLIAHSMIRTFKNPAGEDFDRYELKLNVKAGGLLKEWCDSVLFAHYETYTDKLPSGKVKGISTGARIVSTQRCAAWDAKNRYSLPETLPLDFAAYAEAVKAQRVAPAEDLVKTITERLGELDEGTRNKVNKALGAAAGNPPELARILNKVNALVAQKETAHV